MLGAEVSPQVHDLPSPEGNEHPGRSDTEPLDTVVGAFVGVTQALLSCAHVLHLLHDIHGGLLDTAQVGFDGLELLGGLDGGPILSVGTNVNVEFNGAVSDSVLDS